MAKTYTVGKLTVDLISSESNELVWHGEASLWHNLDPTGRALRRDQSGGQPVAAGRTAALALIAPSKTGRSSTGQRFRRYSPLVELRFPKLADPFRRI